MNVWTWHGCHLCGWEGNKQVGIANHSYHLQDSAPFKTPWMQCGKCGTVFQDHTPEITVLPPHSEDRTKDPRFQDMAKRVLGMMGETRDKVLIDVGAGTCWLTRLLADIGGFRRVVAVDYPGVDMERHGGDNIEIVHACVEDDGAVAALNSHADIVLMWEMIEHVRWPRKWFPIMRDLLKHGGRLVGTFCDPSRVEPAKRSPRELRYPTWKGIEPLVNEAGFKVLSMTHKHYVLERI